MTTQRPSTAQAKDQAKRLRLKMAEDGTPISHARALELVAHQHGFRDWNTMVAAIGDGPPGGWAVGDTLRGRYLSQPFTGTLIAISMTEPGWFRLELQLDEAVDVVTSARFSNFRSRIRGVVGPKGHTVERTSNGQAHLQIDLG
ncbi:glyoxalase superfamily protein [Poseidonocella sedimentorum]|uniref:Glyoxalase-related protein domain-containing protein n=1 Tax=Poseidonocella sedimentorum TaxID=871652 RepID=A0A1I6DTZ9_9RHOB|nr:glyoxalase superfamily protein [Poseidonocella sedimentorum]SFR08821.1 hypothetical protein SAMN04515673_105130 [Poseidonocella sedimentorum]